MIGLPITGTFIAIGGGTIAYGVWEIRALQRTISTVSSTDKALKVLVPLLAAMAGLFICCMAPFYISIALIPWMRGRAFAFFFSAQREGCGEAQHESKLRSCGGCWSAEGNMVWGPLEAGGHPQARAELASPMPFCFPASPKTHQHFALPAFLRDERREHGSQARSHSAAR
jgi:hypothetical protein